MKKIVCLFIVLIAFIACKDEPKTPVQDLENDVKDIVEDSIVEPISEIEELPVKLSVADLKKELETKGFKTFDYVDETTKDTVLMQQYFMAFLKRGPIRGQNEEEAADLQKEHLAHLQKMYDLGYADISGPFGDDGDIRGITIYNVPTLKMADSLAKSDPMVKAGRLEIEIHPWWAAKGFPLR
ncbi:phenylalanyl-tRNA synthetase subunit alpha [Tamlana nanhaiensis]|uniref:Phenylalanyl-tRNA synthetase subunit alpha n=1 Tax=Neotamlana nanhaiensis TaxID=1382798 RepID=A0A0D7W4A5_9FLAO|nr:YciI family protein [Tamlana nanhaiensis]KJD33955.1 phenylalanyl-tRNA synthetase subunit alpha [Tamlana nanhaiensis]